MPEVHVNDVRAQFARDGRLVVLEVVHTAEDMPHQADVPVPEVGDRGPHLEEPVDLLVRLVVANRADDDLVPGVPAHLAKPGRELRQAHGPGVPQGLAVTGVEVELVVRPSWQ